MGVGLCPSCANSIRCDTWGEWKCKKLEKRIYGYKTLTKCVYYKKRPSNFEEQKCQCDDCLKNDLLDEISEEGD